LTPEERAVMLIAIEGGYLNGVIYEHNMRVNGKRFGYVLVAPPIPEEAVSAMVPQFSKVAADLFERRLIEIREPHNGIWAEAPPMTRAQVAAALADRDTWISYSDRDNRMVMVMSTDRWEELVRGNRVAEARQDSTS